jgi:hypothetical protein
LRTMSRTSRGVVRCLRVLPPQRSAVTRQQLIEIVNNEVGRTRLDAATAERARVTFSWDGVTDAYERLFERLSGSERT